MKKILVYLGLGALIMGMTACGNGRVQNTNQGENVKQTGNGSQAGDSSQTGNGSQAGDSSQAGNGSQAGNNGQAGDGSQSEGGGTSGAGDLAGGWSGELQPVKDAIVDALGEDYWPNMQVPPEMLESNYGITPDMYTDYLAEVPMIGTNVDTLLIIKAKDDMVETVQEALNAYRDDLVDNTFQYPMNVGKVQASRIERCGNYICFVQLGAGAIDASDEGDEAVLEGCLEQNELVIAIIRRNIPND